MRIAHGLDGEKRDRGQFSESHSVSETRSSGPLESVEGIMEPAPFWTVKVSSLFLFCSPPEQCLSSVSGPFRVELGTLVTSPIASFVQGHQQVTWTSLEMFWGDSSHSHGFISMTMKRQCGLAYGAVGSFLLSR